MGAEMYTPYHGQDRVYDAYGGYWERDALTELVTLSTSGATTDTVANLLPADSVIKGVTGRVETTITTATAWALGDATDGDRFLTAVSTLTAGTTSVGLNHHAGGVSTDASGPTQAAAAALRVTCTGTPGAGAIRVTVFYERYVAPTA